MSHCCTLKSQSDYTTALSHFLLHLAVPVTPYHHYISLSVKFSCHSHTIPPLYLSVCYIYLSLSHYTTTISVCLLHLAVTVTLYHHNIGLSVTFTCHNHAIQPLYHSVKFSSHSRTIPPLYHSVTFNCHTVPPIYLSLCYI